MTLDDAEYERVLALSHVKRMRYLMKTIAAQRELWTLVREHEPVVLGEPGAPDALAVFPDERFARDFAEGSDAEPQHVTVDEWLDSWLPRMRERRQTVALFPLPEGAGGELTTWQFEEDLREELEGPRPLPWRVRSRPKMVGS